MNQDLSSQAGLFKAFEEYIPVYLSLNGLPPNEREFLYWFRWDVEDILDNFVGEQDWLDILEKARAAKDLEGQQNEQT
ncbi:hypothetical protein [Planktothrix sp. FACHB-1365]|uniref:hypothetical protein n=1 Tax=Planktothrix sp. FACHB-1365 TaxID=2692855 RepID=UPI0016874CCE|nr:hypothetical protein [Planktothrix sp. FACHB-1365]MBD2483518.1 hypothetical protein [Planktothrix sp. FACHB-1365]